MNTVSKIIFVLGVGLLCYLTVKDSHSNELYRVLHSTSIETLNKVQTKIPNFLKVITAKGRNIADEKYKCKLLENTSIKDDC